MKPSVSTRKPFAKVTRSSSARGVLGAPSSSEHEDHAKEPHDHKTSYERPVPQLSVALLLEEPVTLIRVPNGLGELA